MASGARAVGAFALLMVIAPLGAVIVQAGGLRLSAADGQALRFTLQQAGLSALFSVALAVPVARALARRAFWGRPLVISLLGAPFLLPALVAVLGLLTVFGRAGWFNGLLQGLGLPGLSIYGLHGVVFAHLFLNLPLATRMILQAWQAIPAERFRLAQSLDFGPADMMRHIEWPLLRRVLPQAFATVFAICLTSFAIALTLGGGPRATTLELAIYQAVRFDFDLSHAAGLSVLQMALGICAAALAWRLGQGAGFGAGLDRSLAPAAPQGWRKASDVAAIMLICAFFLAPLIGLLIRGLPGLTSLPAAVWPAAGRSLVVALLSALGTSFIALTLAQARARGAGLWIELAAVLPLAASSMVLGTGIFLLVRPFAPPSSLALPLTMAVNMLMALPFAYRLLQPQAAALEADYGRLAASLNMRGFARFRYLTLPRLARPLGFATGLSAALSMGDLGAIALFAAERGLTLPLLIQQLTGAYRMSAAASASLVLLALSFGLFWLFDAGGRRAGTR